MERVDDDGAYVWICLLGLRRKPEEHCPDNLSQQR